MSQDFNPNEPHVIPDDQNIQYVQQPVQYVQAPVQYAPAPVEPPKKKRRTWLWALLGLLVLFGIIRACSGGNDNEVATPTPPAATTPAAENNEPAVTAEPEPEPAGDWLANEFPVFEPETFSGTGSDVITLPGYAGIIKWDNPDINSGTIGNWFNLTVLDSEHQEALTDRQMTWGHNRGMTNGVFAYGLSWTSSDDATSLQIEATGDWTLTIYPLSAAELLPESGDGDGVFRAEVPSATTWRIESQGDSGNFRVTQVLPNAGILGHESNSLVFENNPYAGTVPVRAGNSVIVIESDGSSWTITQ